MYSSTFLLTFLRPPRNGVHVCFISDIYPVSFFFTGPLLRSILHFYWSWMVIWPAVLYGDFSNFFCLVTFSHHRAIRLAKLLHRPVSRTSTRRSPTMSRVGGIRVTFFFFFLKYPEASRIGIPKIAIYWHVSRDSFHYIRKQLTDSSSGV